MRPDNDVIARGIFRAHSHTIQAGLDLRSLLEEAITDAEYAIKSKTGKLERVRAVLNIFDDNMVQIIATYGTFEELFPHFVNRGCMSYFLRYDSLD